MNAIQQLQAQLREALPRTSLDLNTPHDPNGIWMMYATLDDHMVSIEWSPRHGFGLSASVLGDGLGEGPEEVFEALPEAFERARHLLAERAYTRPPTKVLLQELRARLAVTQRELADRLGVQQAAVSKLERREEISLASLQRYVEALGGTLEIGFRDREGSTWPLLAATPEAKARPRTPPGGRARPDASIRALVLRCQDLQASRAFYSLLGCELTEEKHGSGPLHYAFFSGELLVELYPISPKHPPTRGLRLTLQVNELHRRLGDLETHELLRQVIGSAPARPAPLVRDPDDNILELEEADAASSEIPRPSVAS